MARSDMRDHFGKHPAGKCGRIFCLDPRCRPAGECAFPACDCPGEVPVCPDYRSPAEVYGLTQRDSALPREGGRESANSVHNGREGHG